MLKGERMKIVNRVLPIIIAIVALNWYVISAYGYSYFFLAISFLSIPLTQFLSGSSISGGFFGRKEPSYLDSAVGGGLCLFLALKGFNGMAVDVLPEESSLLGYISVIVFFLHCVGFATGFELARRWSKQR